ncbi:unannotated protein [freshwater metagenome]|uniref:Unannotated protein n=1 Tax=freshwater metagenome TaxID=449393 RepID=A0A6J7K7J0_9ZZZZ
MPLAAACEAIMRPTGVEPVKEIFAISGWFTKRAPAV